MIPCLLLLLGVWVALYLLGVVGAVVGRLMGLDESPGGR